MKIEEQRTGEDDLETYGWRFVKSTFITVLWMACVIVFGSLILLALLQLLPLNN